MSIARVRVELKDLPHGASKEQKERAFKNMFSKFKRQVNEAGILSQHKEKQFFEGKGEKRRRKRRESEVERRKELKAKLRNYFG